ncbi:putative reverse transcriptase domain-containing protein [Tanacetum coccineum]
MVVATEPTTIQSDVLKAGMLTNEEIRSGALKKVTKKRGNNGEPSRDGNARNDNKRSRTGRAFSTTTNPVKKDYTGTEPKCLNYNYHHQPEVPCHLCTNCNRFGHIAKDCRVGPRIVNPLNARNPTAAHEACFECGGTGHYKAVCPRLNQAPRPGGNRPNQVMAIEGGQGCGNNGNQVHGRAFVMGAEEAHGYIEIASGQLVEIYKVIRGCKLEIEGHIFDIDLIPFGHRSFDVIVGMDWLSRLKAGIVFHEKVVRIPLLNGEILRVLGEKLEEKVRHSKSVKFKEQKLKDIVVVRNFPEVFPDDLSGLPPSREIKFHINLIPGAMPVVKYPHCLAPTEMEELSSQPRELQDKGFIRPSSSPWGAPLQEVQFLGHVINDDDLHVDSNKIEAVNNWEAPQTPSEVRSFLGLAGYYRRFIENFSKLAKPLSILTQKHKEYV